MRRDECERLVEVPRRREGLQVWDDGRRAVWKLIARSARLELVRGRAHVEEMVCERGDGVREGGLARVEDSDVRAVYLDSGKGRKIG